MKKNHWLQIYATEYFLVKISDKIKHTIIIFAIDDFKTVLICIDLG